MGVRHLIRTPVPLTRIVTEIQTLGVLAERQGQESRALTVPIMSSLDSPGDNLILSKIRCNWQVEATTIRFGVIVALRLRVFEVSLTLSFPPHL